MLEICCSTTQAIRTTFYFFEDKYRIKNDNNIVICLFISHSLFTIRLSLNQLHYYYARASVSLLKAAGWVLWLMSLTKDSCFVLRAGTESYVPDLRSMSESKPVNEEITKWMRTLHLNGHYDAAIEWLDRCTMVSLDYCWFWIPTYQY